MNTHNSTHDSQLHAESKKPDTRSSSHLYQIPKQVALVHGGTSRSGAGWPGGGRGHGGQVMLIKGTVAFLNTTGGDTGVTFAKSH